jgi:dsRNA-specific ribonuclease
VECRIDALGVVTQGEGASRKTAEQQAASAALALLEKP